MTKAYIRISILATSILLISLSHYFTPIHLHYIHDIFQRFYYLPIILAALWFGFRGGLMCSLIVSIVYAPHILFQWGGHLTLEMEKYLEIVMYNVVGTITGGLAQREREQSQKLQRTAKGLEESLEKLKIQSDRIIATEEQLRRAEKLSTLGEMSAVLAHEIRNPLGSIRGTAEILRDDYKVGDPKHEFIEIQIKETERINHLVEDFLRMARPQFSEMKSCSLAEELETIVTLTHNDATKRGVGLVLETLDDDMYYILGNGEKLRQAFLNIVLNALQATGSGGTVTITAKKCGDKIEIVFKDSGSGISEESLEHIFEPFYTTKVDGTGLGLAVTKKIVEAHAGTIVIESEIGKGTTVIVRLPVEK